MVLFPKSAKRKKNRFFNGARSVTFSRWIIYFVFTCFQVAIIFGLQTRKIKLYRNRDRNSEVKDDTKLESLHGSTLYAFVN